MSETLTNPGEAADTNNRAAEKLARRIAASPNADRVQLTVLSSLVRKGANDLASAVVISASRKPKR